MIAVSYNIKIESNHSNQFRALHYPSILLFIHPVALNLVFCTDPEYTHPFVRKRETHTMKTIITKLRFCSSSVWPFTAELVAIPPHFYISLHVLSQNLAQLLLKTVLVDIITSLIAMK